MVAKECLWGGTRQETRIGIDLMKSAWNHMKSVWNPNETALNPYETAWNQYESTWNHMKSNEAAWNPNGTTRNPCETDWSPHEIIWNPLETIWIPHQASLIHFLNSTGSEGFSFFAIMILLHVSFKYSLHFVFPISHILFMKLVFEIEYCFLFSIILYFFLKRN